MTGPKIGGTPPLLDGRGSSQPAKFPLGVAPEEGDDGGRPINTKIRTLNRLSGFRV